MRDHYFEVCCGCGARRVIALGMMAEHSKTRSVTLASVAAKVQCAARRSGPDEVHLPATIYGIESPPVGGNIARGSRIRKNKAATS